AHFWRQLGGVARPGYDLLQSLEGESWPGNVRELRNAVARRLALGDLPEADLDAGSVPPPKSGDAIERVLGRELPFSIARTEVLRDFERRYVERVLARHGGNVTHAAQASGIARRYFNKIRSRQK